MNASSSPPAGFLKRHWLMFRALPVWTQALAVVLLVALAVVGVA